MFVDHSETEDMIKQRKEARKAKFEEIVLKATPIIFLIIFFFPLIIQLMNTEYKTYTAEAVVYEREFIPAHTETDTKADAVPVYSIDGGVAFAYVPKQYQKYVPAQFIVTIQYKDYSLTVDNESVYNKYEVGETISVIVSEEYYKNTLESGKIKLESDKNVIQS